MLGSVLFTRGRGRLPSIRAYLGIAIITPATLFHSGAVLLPGGLGVRTSTIAPIVVPALLTRSWLGIVPAGLRVALRVAPIVVPATLGLRRVSVIFIFVVMPGRMLCGGLFSLQRKVGGGGGGGGFGGRRAFGRKDGRTIFRRQSGFGGFDRGLQGFYKAKGRRI